MNFRNDAEAMNAVINGLGALVFALVHELPTERRAGFAATLAHLANAARREGASTTEAVLTDLHRAAVAAA
ncbi:hypothetical protein [Acidovorax cavernicola]|uniref:Uncharacterized protein n=1 Tax=Acidovorax cavernicola TaxID=1675792 RepID=A0A9X8GST3_9BURK|nr:hypothetical protein [Acidovorax cavernicola]RIX74456.1 hypothetical protein D3H34_27375 [Acidovorax cavernicola]